MPPIATIGTTIIKLLEKRHFLSASDIVSELQKTRPSLNKTSVYRSLEKLLSENKVCRHNLLDTELVYELRDHHHDHIVCTNCGKVETAECHVHHEDVHGFTISHHHLTLFGMCPTCQRKS